MSDSFWIGLDWMHKYIISFVLFSEHFLAGWGFHIASHTPPSPSPIHLPAWSIFGGNGLYMTTRSARMYTFTYYVLGVLWFRGGKGKGKEGRKGEREGVYIAGLWIHNHDTRFEQSTTLV